MTRQRELIFEILKESGHLTAEEIFLKARECMPHIAMGTVYRNLGLMVADGQIGKISTCGAPDIYDRTVLPHEHCVCECCGGVHDIEVDGFKEELERLFGTEITSYNLDVKYLCDNCKSVTDADKKSVQ